MHTPDVATGDATLNTYLRTVSDPDAPLLGALAIYNVTAVEQVSTEKLANWFAELDIDVKHLPSPPRPIEAFEKATSQAKVTYPLPLGGVRRRDHHKTGQTVTLMMRNVVRDETRIVRHLVRELVDHGNAELSYEVKVAEATFVRATGQGVDPGDGEMTIEPADVSALSPNEQIEVEKLITAVTDDYEDRQRYVGADRLRKILRDVLEDDLAGIRIHNGVYFVHRDRLEALAALRTLADRFGAELTRVPLPNNDEMRGMVDGAANAKITADLRSLNRDLAREKHTGAKPYRVRVLERRFREIKDAVEQYRAQMGTHLDELCDGWDLANDQMADLYMSVGQDDQQPDDQTEI